MSHQRIVFIACAAGALAIATLAAAQAPQRVPVGPTGPDGAAPLVVMIRGTIGEAPTAGAGIIIDVANDRLYLATANHVIRRGMRDATNLQVQLKWLPGEWIAARVLEHADATLDLAVLAVPEASRLGVPRLAWQALIRPDTLTRGMKVFPIGYPGGNPWFIAVQPHVVTAVTTSGIRTEGNLVDGHSGGALVTGDGGIVGLVSRYDSLVGESQRIDRVVERLSEWGYRVTLTSKAAGASTDPGPSDSDPKGQVPATNVLDLRQGTWTLVDSVDAENTNWSGSVLKITNQQPVDSGLNVSGLFEWRRAGALAGTEWVTGTYHSASRQLFLEGTRVTIVNDGSGRRIVPGSYSAIVSGDGRRLTDGRWGNISGAEPGVPGRWQAYR